MRSQIPIELERSCQRFPPPSEPGKAGIFLARVRSATVIQIGLDYLERGPHLTYCVFTSAAAREHLNEIFSTKFKPTSCNPTTVKFSISDTIRSQNNLDVRVYCGQCLPQIVHLFFCFLFFIKKEGESSINTGNCNFSLTILTY